MLKRFALLSTLGLVAMFAFSVVIANHRREALPAAPPVPAWYHPEEIAAELAKTDALIANRQAEPVKEAPAPAPVPEPKATPPRPSKPLTEELAKDAFQGASLDRVIQQCSQKFGDKLSAAKLTRDIAFDRVAKIGPDGTEAINRARILIVASTVETKFDCDATVPAAKRAATKGLNGYVRGLLTGKITDGRATVADLFEKRPKEERSRLLSGAVAFVERMKGSCKFPEDDDLEAISAFLDKAERVGASLPNFEALIFEARANARTLPTDKEVCDAQRYTVTIAARGFLAVLR